MGVDKQRNRRKLFLAGISLLLASPVLLVLGNVPPAFSEEFYYLSQHLLGTYMKNTLVVMVGVSILTTIFGVSSAWWVVTNDFPFRKHLEWLLVLPLAIPPFINGITYAGLIDYTGPIRIFLRSVPWFTDFNMDIMNSGGVIAVMSFVLYPYVYLTSRAVFALQSSSFIEASRTLGAGHFKTLFTVALPVAWPGIFSGLLLVIMEVLNDYGTVHYYGVSTFTTGIFKSWLSLGDLPSAILLAIILIVFVLILLFLEEKIRGKKKFEFLEGPLNARVKLSRCKRWLVFFGCFTPFILGFVIPVSQMVFWCSLSFDKIRWEDMTRGISNTLQVAIISSILVVFTAWLFAFLQRRTHLTGLWKYITKLAILGYSMPGAILGIGVVTLALSLNPNWLFIGTEALIIGYLSRFFVVGFNPITSGYTKIPTSVDESSLLLGKGTGTLLTKVHFPLLRPAIIAALIMVFIDITKELPLTLILRPFNFETIATQAFQFATDEMVIESSAPSLIIILIAAFPVYFIHRIFTVR